MDFIYEYSASSVGEVSKISHPIFLRGAMDILPLSISVIPWAILAGSMAIHAGLSFYKALAMSGIVFAGAAQLVSLSMVIEGASTFTIYVTIFFLTAQHFIYALTLRNDISALSLSKRLSLGFLLTDELFAVCASGEKTARISVRCRSVFLFILGSF